MFFGARLGRHKFTLRFQLCLVSSSAFFHCTIVSNYNFTHFVVRFTGMLLSAYELCFQFLEGGSKLLDFLFSFPDISIFLSNALVEHICNSFHDLSDFLQHFSLARFGGSLQFKNSLKVVLHIFCHFYGINRLACLHFFQITQEFFRKLSGSLNFVHNLVYVILSAKAFCFSLSGLNFCMLHF